MEIVIERSERGPEYVDEVSGARARVLAKADLITDVSGPESSKGRTIQSNAKSSLPSAASDAGREIRNESSSIQRRRKPPKILAGQRDHSSPQGEAEKSNVDRGF